MFSFDHLSKDVEHGLYAATIRGILLYHMHCTQRLISYGDLAIATQNMPNGGQLAHALERIAEDDYQAKRPISTAIVVSTKEGLPGHGFFKQCRSLGFEFEDTAEGRVVFWEQQLTALGFEFEDTDAGRSRFWDQQITALGKGYPKPDVHRNSRHLANRVANGLEAQHEVSILELLWNSEEEDLPRPKARKSRSAG
jgi:hypothetical protein